MIEIWKRQNSEFCKHINCSWGVRFVINFFLNNGETERRWSQKQVSSLQQQVYFLCFFDSFLQLSFLSLFFFFFYNICDIGIPVLLLLCCPKVLRLLDLEAIWVVPVLTQLKILPLSWYYYSCGNHRIMCLNFDLITFFVRILTVKWHNTSRGFPERTLLLK